MFKVLPQMHRLVDQICAAYGVRIAHVVVDSENVGVRTAHYPYYIVELDPNDLDWRYVCCRPHKPEYNSDYSKSTNNVDVVVRTFGPGMDGLIVLPSWRGKLLSADELERCAYYIRRGYMMVKPTADYIENALIDAYSASGAAVNSLAYF